MGKRNVHVKTIEELRALVDELLQTGERPRVTFPPELMIAAYKELGRFVDHVREQGDPVEVKAEVVSYAKNTWIDYKGHRYVIMQLPSGKFTLRVKKPCGSTINPWDFDHDTFDDAELHAKAYINSQQEEP